MSREVKIGILAFVVILGSVWGYAFLKGRNLLTNSYNFYAKFHEVDQLSTSAPIFVSGYQIGTVKSISLDPTDMKTIVVEMSVEKRFGIPSNTVAVLISTGLMGQKGIELQMDGPCSGADCAKSGDFFEARKESMMESMLGEDTLGEAMAGIGTGLGTAFDTINQRLSDPANDGRISSILRNIDDLSAALVETSKDLDLLIVNMNRNLTGLTKSMNGVVENIEKNNDAIEDILQNAAGFTGQLNDSNMKGAIDGLATTMNSADKTLVTMEQTMKELEASLGNFKRITESIDSGEGTMGKLVKDEELYNNLNRMSKNLDLMLQDFRLNPKRYVNVSVFGKKQKEYEIPENDPAFNSEEDQ